jgi:hypothetical protein
MTTALVGSLTTLPVHADPTFTIGLSWAFGGGAQKGELGLSARVLSDNKRNKWVAAIGGTYYPKSNKFGVDLGVGYNFRNTPITMSYDFINDQAVLGLGWANLTDPNKPEVIDYLR